jgi:hypothetical protein
MKTTTEKKAYRSPQIERITLDKEISLAMSSPADLPVWTDSKVSYQDDLFRSNVG